MKILKNITISVAAIIVLVMAVATFIENAQGTPFVTGHIYGAWWFVALWAILTITGAACLVRLKVYKRPPVLMLHLAFVIILAGAFTTYITAKRGTVHLRKGEPASAFVTDGNVTKDFGFTLKLKDFEIKYYPGTDAPMDYVSVVSVDNEDIGISMNNIGRHNGYRFLQSGYDSDMQGTTIGVSYDPWGIGITYTGYLLLLISVILVIFTKHSNIRSLYKKAAGKQALVILLLTLSSSQVAAAPDRSSAVDKKLADSFGRVCVLYNSRICPANTVAISFVTKLSGKPTWNGYSANEIFAGWIFNFTLWENEKMILVKDKEAQRALGIDGKWASFNDFWNEYNEYKLEHPLAEAYSKGDKDMIKHLRDADEKFNIIRMFYNGELLRIFPYPDKSGNIKWLAPGEKNVSVNMPEKEWFFVRKSMDYLTESITLGDNARAATLIKKISDYQRVRAKEVTPSAIAVKAELLYNSLHTQRWPVMLFLAVSLLLVVLNSVTEDKGNRQRIKTGSLIMLVIMLIHTTMLMSLRWLVSNHLPISNGYETMVFLSWAMLIVTLCIQKRFPIILNFGLLLSAFALLVAMISGGNPQITQLMPVLQSPLLSAHVMVIMFAYALFAIMAFVGIQGIAMHHKRQYDKEESLAALSQLLLYPATFLLAIGIFVGAVWANVSWGRYWGWDSKEVWALITMLIYAAPLHKSIKWMHKPLHIHIYMLLAFLTVLMTYFGVNYVLGGMHSYA